MWTVRSDNWGTEVWQIRYTQAPLQPTHFSLSHFLHPLDLLHCPISLCLFLFWPLSCQHLIMSLTSVTISTTKASCWWCVAQQRTLGKGTSITLSIQQTTCSQWHAECFPTKKTWFCTDSGWQMIICHFDQQSVLVLSRINYIMKTGWHCVTVCQEILLPCSTCRFYSRSRVPHVGLLSVLCFPLTFQMLVCKLATP